MTINEPISLWSIKVGKTIYTYDEFYADTVKKYPEYTVINSGKIEDRFKKEDK